MENATLAQEQEKPGRVLPAMLLTALIGLVVVFASPYRASNLPIVPDSVEYAIGGLNITETGQYLIHINGHDLPSRYPPWFSLIAIAPSYLVFGPQPGNAIIPITLFSIMGVIAAFLIGQRISGSWGGFASAAILLLLPAYRGYSRHVMTDIPCSALALLLGLLYLDMRRSCRPPALRLFAVAGIAAGIAAAFRPACAAFVLPFLLLAIRPLKPAGPLMLRILLMVIPQLLVAAATMFYNLTVFGSVSENGYKFWCPATFHDFTRVISASFLGINIMELLLSGLPALMLAAACLWVSHIRGKKEFAGEKREIVKSISNYIVIGTGPIVILHLFYFWPDLRFFLPTLAVLAALTGGLIGRFLENVSGRFLFVIQAVSLVAVLVFRLVQSPAVLMRRSTADLIISSTRSNALIISSIDPVYLEYFTCGNSQRRVLPMSRNVEYTSTSVVLKTSGRIPVNQGSNPAGDKPRAGLYPYVAEERMDLVEDEIRKGIPVFMDTSQISEHDLEAVGKISDFFTLIQRSQYLYELKLKQ